MRRSGVSRCSGKSCQVLNRNTAIPWDGSGRGQPTHHASPAMGKGEDLTPTYASRGVQPGERWRYQQWISPTHSTAAGNRTHLPGTGATPSAHRFSGQVSDGSLRLRWCRGGFSMMGKPGAIRDGVHSHWTQKMRTAAAMPGRHCQMGLFSVLSARLP